MRWLLVVIGLLVAGVLLLAVLGLFFSGFLVDVWWFDALGQGLYFWQRLLYKYAVFAFVTALFCTLFWVNFWLAAKHLGVRRAATDVALNNQRPLRRFQRGSRIVYIPLSLLLAVIVAVPLYLHWESALFYFFGFDANAVDPTFGKDISFYFFSLPVYLLVMRSLLLVFGILLLSLTLLYWLEKRVLSKSGQALPVGARVHLSVLVVLVFCIAAGDFFLQRYELLYVTPHLPLFYGPGYVEMNITLPLIWAASVLLLGFAVALVAVINARKGWTPLIICALLFAIVLPGRYYTSILAEPFYKYIVKPDELAKESPYIKNSIEATLAAYGLDQVESRDYPIKDLPWDTASPQLLSAANSIPVWNKDTMLDVYRQLQEIRTYYEFPSVDVDRYRINGVYQQVFLAARELNLDELPSGAKTWVNEWLKYSHGYGAVMTPAAQTSAGPLNWYLQDLPPRSEVGLKLAEPAIYYGLEKDRPVIVPNENHELDYPLANGDQTVDYQGDGGVKLTGLFRKLVFALYYREKNIVLTTDTNDRSRLLLRRNIVERIKKITPFLMLDDDPYLVVTPERTVWIQDAYTWSNWYPNAQPYEGEYLDVPTSQRPVANVGQKGTQPQRGEKFNYLRNSVKIVVDAYDGSVDYYIFDPEDPISDAYKRIYPGLFKDAAAMPPSLKEHVRYPRDLFNIQMSIYANYHQTDPGTFYQQADKWMFPQIEPGQPRSAIHPYYLMLNLIDREKTEFLLLAPMNTAGRNTLRAVAVAGNDADHYGKIVIYNFPRGAAVYGPGQFSALIKQNPEITEQLNLWNQGGSQVVWGDIIAIPVEGVIVYVQPLYLRATSGANIPELERLIVGQGERIVMEPTLKESFAELNKLVGEIDNAGPPPTTQALPGATHSVTLDETKSAARRRRPEHSGAAASDG